MYFTRQPKCHLLLTMRYSRLIELQSYSMSQYFPDAMATHSETISIPTKEVCVLNVCMMLFKCSLCSLSGGNCKTEGCFCFHKHAYTLSKGAFSSSAHRFFFLSVQFHVLVTYCECYIGMSKRCVSSSAE